MPCIRPCFVVSVFCFMGVDYGSVVVVVSPSPVSLWLFCGFCSYCYVITKNPVCGNSRESLAFVSVQVLDGQ